jgi:hypothetical protein
MGVVVDIEAFDALANGIDKAAGECVSTLSECIRETGGEILKKAGEIAGWSAKIPRSLRLKMIGKTTVLITAGDEKTPTAYMFEIGKTPLGNKWNFPVYPGDEESKANWHWVPMKRPHREFLTPAILDVGLQAVDALGDEIVDLIDAAIEEAGV